MSKDAFIRQIRDLIAGGKLDKALPLLRALLQNTPHLNEAIQQSARYADICRKARLGAVGSTDADLAQNQISWGVLELLSELERQGGATGLDGLLDAVEEESKHPDLQQEITKSISVMNSENVIVESTLTAGGNIHIGNIVYTEKAPSDPQPKHDFNKALTQTLTEALRPYSDNAERLARDFAWLDQPADRRKVQNFICRSFIGEIGKQMRDLINIGDYEDMEADKKQRHYVQKCLGIAKRAFDVVNYGLLSVWWDTVKTAPRAISPAQRDILADWFGKHFEHTLQQQFHLLQTLHAVFTDHQKPIPFLELPALAPQLTHDSPLHNACAALQALAKSPCSVADCAAAESHLAAILRHFAFLSLYRMVSIKKIGYRQMRNEHPRFLHQYIALGIDKKFSEDAEKVNYTDLGEQTPAVLLYRGDDYQHGINLFPFIIDYNALTFEQGAKVCFFSATDLSDGALEYRFLGDNSILRIERTGILKPDTNLNELLLQPENLKFLNLDCLVDSFRDARRAIVGEETINFDEL